MLREIVKWDYELRRADQVRRCGRSRADAGHHLARPARSISPCRARSWASRGWSRRHRARPRPSASAASVARTTSRASPTGSRRRALPLIITSSRRPSSRGQRRAARLAERFALPVVGSSPRHFVLPSSHPMYMGSTVGALLAGSRPGHRAGGGCSLDPQQGIAAAGRAHRADRRGPALRALSDAQFPQRPHDQGGDRRRCCRRWRRRSPPGAGGDARRAQVVAARPRLACRLARAKSTPPAASRRSRCRGSITACTRCWTPTRS